MKLVLGVCLLSGLALVVLYGILMGVMVTGWQNSVNELWGVAAVETRDLMIQVVNQTLAFIQFAAHSVPQFTPITQNNSAYNPSALLRSFAAFNEMSGYHFGSMGFLMHAAPPHPSTAKVSWPVATGFGCPTDMYAYSDDLVNPNFYGYCGQSDGTWNLTNPPAYVGSDWGLKPQEIALLDSPQGSGLFLPVFDLLGAFTLTYESVFVMPPSGKALTFAELDLTLLSNYIASQIHLLQGRGLAYIYESQTGAMIASTINDTLFMASNHSRYTIYNSPSEAIRLTADGQDDAWLVLFAQRTEPGLNWTMIVAARESDIKGNIDKGIVVASVSGLCVLIVLVALSWLGIYCCVTRQLTAKRQGDVSIPYTVFDEIK